MAIPDEDVAQVRAATDIVALIGEHSALKRVGRRWSGLCPFHSEKTPSFSVNAEEGFYYCFGCQASGDVITFVRAIEHLDFPEAVRFLADRAGVVIHEDVELGQDHRRRGELLSAMEQAVAWYHDRLVKGPDAGPAREYLRSRGYDGDIVRKFRLGWAPDEWDALVVALKLSERTMTGAGLGFVNRRGKAQDFFRARIIFPICDPSGRPIALGGRIVPQRRDGRSLASGSPRQYGRVEPKYKNSQETLIYSKRRTLYALNWAKHDIVASGEVVVCEGYTDVIGFFQALVPRAVATCGTALGEEHFRLLRNYGKRIVLAYDADNAGQSATSRVYEWERKHEVDLVVAALPEGTDPGDLAQRDPEALARAVSEARPFLQFRIDREFLKADLSTAEGRARVADLALSAVAEHPDDLVRDQYVMQVADRCRLDPNRLRERLESLRASLQKEANRSPSARSKKSSSAGSRNSFQNLERADEPWRDNEEIYDNDYSSSERFSKSSTGFGPKTRERNYSSHSKTNAGSNRPGLEALRLVVHWREEIGERLNAVLFSDPLQREAYEALLANDSLHEAIESSSPMVADLLRRVAVEEPIEGDVSLDDSIASVVTVLIREAVRVALLELSQSARSATGSFEMINSEMTRVRQRLEKLDEPESWRASFDELVAWLVVHNEENKSTTPP